jgi:hypothetical protein
MQTDQKYSTGQTTDKALRICLLRVELGKAVTLTIFLGLPTSSNRITRITDR